MESAATFQQNWLKFKNKSKTIRNITNKNQL